MKRIRTFKGPKVKQLKKTGEFVVRMTEEEALRVAALLGQASAGDEHKVYTLFNALTDAGGIYESAEYARLTRKVGDQLHTGYIDLK